MRYLPTTTFLFLLLAVSSAANAGGHCCPRCSEPCYPEVSVEDVTKHCWKVECKKVCIPRLTFPWQTCKQSCCCNTCPQPAKCGRVRTVRVLVKHEYECKKCKYKWEVNDIPCSGNGCTQCNGAGCASGCASCTNPAVALPPQPPYESDLDYGGEQYAPQPVIEGQPVAPSPDETLFQSLKTLFQTR